MTSGKTPYVRFDRNAYSIPHTHVRRPITLLASATTVRLIAGPDEIARHPRSYDTGQTTLQPRRYQPGLLLARLEGLDGGAVAESLGSLRPSALAMRFPSHAEGGGRYTIDGTRCAD